MERPRSCLDVGRLALDLPAGSGDHDGVDHSVSESTFRATATPNVTPVSSPFLSSKWPTARSSAEALLRTCVCSSADEVQVAAGTKKNTVAIYSNSQLPPQPPLVTLRDKDDPQDATVSSLSWRGSLMAAGTSQKTLIWDVEEQTLLGQISNEGTSHVSFNGHHTSWFVLATCARESSVKIWDLRDFRGSADRSSAKLVLRSRHNLRFRKARWNPSDPYLATVQGGDVWIWDMRLTDRPCTIFSAQDNFNVVDIDWSPRNPEHLISVNAPGTVRMWSCRSPRSPLWTQSNHRSTYAVYNDRGNALLAFGEPGVTFKLRELIHRKQQTEGTKIKISSSLRVCRKDEAQQIQGFNTLTTCSDSSRVSTMSVPPTATLQPFSLVFVPDDVLGHRIFDTFNLAHVYEHTYSGARLVDFDRVLHPTSSVPSIVALHADSTMSILRIPFRVVATCRGEEATPSLPSRGEIFQGSLQNSFAYLSAEHPSVIGSDGSGSPAIGGGVRGKQETRMSSTGRVDRKPLFAETKSASGDGPSIEGVPPAHSRAPSSKTTVESSERNGSVAADCPEPTSEDPHLHVPDRNGPSKNDRCDDPSPALGMDQGQKCGITFARSGAIAVFSNMRKEDEQSGVVEIGSRSPRALASFDPESVRANCALDRSVLKGDEYLHIPMESSQNFSGYRTSSTDPRRIRSLLGRHYHTLLKCEVLVMDLRAWVGLHHPQMDLFCTSLAARYDLLREPRPERADPALRPASASSTAAEVPRSGATTDTWEDVVRACEHNARIAEEFDEPEIASVWRLVTAAAQEDPLRSPLAAIMLTNLATLLRPLSSKMQETALLFKTLFAVHLPMQWTLPKPVLTALEREVLREGTEARQAFERRWRKSRSSSLFPP